jgi:hypothetical protein
VRRRSSILELALLDTTFKPPPKALDLARHWQTATRRFEAEIDSTTATPRVSALGLRLGAALHPLLLNVASNRDRSIRTRWS